jgi:hypothetical protein
MKKYTMLFKNRLKIIILTLILLCLSGIISLSAQSSCIQPMDELFPELRWLNNRDIDGVELPHPQQEKPRNILEGLEIPPQRPFGRFDRD